MLPSCDAAAIPSLLQIAGKRMTQMLLENGADLEIVDRDHDTALLISLKYDRHEALRPQLSWQADYLRRDYGGQTVLHICADRGDKQTAQILANHELYGLNPHVEDINGHTALIGSSRETFTRRTRFLDFFVLWSKSWTSSSVRGTKA